MLYLTVEILTCFIVLIDIYVYRHEKHKSYHLKYPEVFLFEDQQQNQLPVYFGNVCLQGYDLLRIP